MSTELKLTALIVDRMGLNPIQAMYLADIMAGRSLSWTFAPYTLKRSLRPLIDRRWIAIKTETFEGDPQVYEFLALTQIGLEAFKEAMAP